MMKILTAIGTILLLMKCNVSCAFFQAVVSCRLVIGERDQRDDTRHRRLVRMDLPMSCDSSDNIVIEVSYENLQRSFDKVLSSTFAENQLKGKLFGYWYGEDRTDGSSFNYIQDARGHVHGSLVNVKDNMVMQFQVENGIPFVTITNSSSFPEELDSISIEDETYYQQYFAGDESLILSEEFGSEITVSSPEEIPRSQKKVNKITKRNKKLTRKQIDQNKDDDSNTLDILVVWTLDAECKNANRQKQCISTTKTVASMEALINLAISETNTAFQLSGVKTELRLVHAYRHPNYQEEGFSSTLNDARTNKIPGLHAYREFFKADLVAVIIDDSNYCGIAYIGPSKNLMFSVTSWSCATGYFSFGHEVGHNLGLQHDRGTSNACNDNNYNYGYRNKEGRFRSILAYACQRGQCDNNLARGSCIRVQRFSNIEFDYQGSPIGSEFENNARKINEVRLQVASYFSSTPAPTSRPTTRLISSTQPSVLFKTPTRSPTSSPTASSTQSPPTFPLSSPTSSLTQSPTVSPTSSPSSFPTPSPTSSPTPQPTSSPSLSPTSSPTPQPTSSPTIAPVPSNVSSCVDSKSRFEIKWKNGKSKESCRWVSRNRKIRCSIKGVQSICPATCGTCLDCFDTNLKFDIQNLKKVKCKDVAKGKNGLSCDIPGVSQTCRATCGC